MRHTVSRGAYITLAVALAVVAVVVVVTQSRHNGTAAASHVTTSHVTASPAAPTGFQPTGFSFISTDTGWVIGTVLPCASTACPGIERTTDGGRTWRRTSAPEVAESGDLVFVDPLDGWVYDDHDLWSTHDAGATWQRGPHGFAPSVAVSGGVVRVALDSDGGTLSMDTSPTGSENWTRSTVDFPEPAGGMEYPSLFSSGNRAWVLLNGRTSMAGARLVGGTWSAWPPPPCGGNGTANLNAVSPDEILVLCGRPGPVDNGAHGEQLLVSTNGGDSFRQAGTAWPSVATAGAGLLVATPHNIVVWLDDTVGARLLSTTDGGLRWHTTYDSPPGNRFGDMGFLSPHVGYIVEEEQTWPETHLSRLLVTADGGRTWTATLFAT